MQPIVRPLGGRSAALATASLVLAACAGDDGVTQPARCQEPAVVSSAVTAVAGNALAAIVTARTLHTDSIAVRYRPVSAADDSVTPSVPVTSDQVVAPVLGLLPETGYAASLVAYGACGAATGQDLAFTTGALPADLPSYAAEGLDPSPGYVAFAAGSYGLVIDNTGRIVWYHRFDGGPGLNFQPQPNGRYVARPPSPDPAAPWLEIDPLGRVTRTLGCARGLAPRFHDLIVAPEGSYWVMCDETRTMDLSSSGGHAAAQVTGTGVQHLSATAELLFEWSPFDRFEVADADPASLASPQVNWTHGNAIALDDDGNLLISFRNLSEVTKIDTRTGEVVWRLGGVRNQFTFVGSGLPPFAKQHGLRVPRGGEVVLLDNLGDPAGSRAERYLLDESAMTARMVAVYDPGDGVVAQLGGTTQPLTDGHTLVSYGSGGRVEEYDANGRVAWRILGSPGYVFRAHRIRSLYTPGR
jgi:hypothetical protein